LGYVSPSIGSNASTDRDVAGVGEGASAAGVRAARSVGDVDADGAPARSLTP
jgi:hypothetical protein